MKQSEMIVLALAGVAVYLIVKGRGGAVSLGNVTRDTAATVNEIFNSNGTPFDNGWRYYSDGTAIDPTGAYYKDGQRIWSPSGSW